VNWWQCFKMDWYKHTRQDYCIIGTKGIERVELMCDISIELSSGGDILLPWHTKKEIEKIRERGNRE